MFVLTSLTAWFIEHFIPENNWRNVYLFICLLSGRWQCFLIYGATFESDVNEMKWEFSNLAEIQSSDLSWSLGRVVHSRLIFVWTFSRYFRRSLCTYLFTCSIFNLKVACVISSVVTKMTTPAWLTCKSLTSKQKSDHPADYFLLLPLYEVLPLIIETPARRLTRETAWWPSERSRRREESGAVKWQVVSGVRDVSRRRNYKVKEVSHPPAACEVSFN